MPCRSKRLPSQPEPREDRFAARRSAEPGGSANSAPARAKPLTTMRRPFHNGKGVRPNFKFVNKLEIRSDPHNKNFDPVVKVDKQPHKNYGH